MSAPARKRLVDELSAALPSTYTVMGYPTGLDRVTGPTVCVWQETVTKTDQFGPPRLRVDLAVWVLTGQEDPGKADDVLDDALTQVLAALQPLGWIDWTSAERLVPEFVTAHGFKLTCTALTEPLTL
ncbi:MAG: hypothetical protein KJ548_00155 [Actinobacteria bacterium]|nr:hypothetical protein [Actinomycetota bacterium]MCG2797720.1 hypothetical protein [Cellulomonas sp.]